MSRERALQAAMDKMDELQRNAFAAAAGPPAPARRGRSSLVTAFLAGLVLAGTIAALAVPETLGQPLIQGEALVVDGDTIWLCSVNGSTGHTGTRHGSTPCGATSGTKVRIAGMDAPELGQMCGAVPCGQAAKRALTDAIRGALVTCKPSGLDRYGRTLAQCATADVRDLGAHMVGAGYARSYVRYGDRYRDAEDAARAERVGLWRAGNFGNPEDWRRGR